MWISGRRSPNSTLTHRRQVKTPELLSTCTTTLLDDRWVDFTSEFHIWAFSLCCGTDAPNSNRPWKQQWGASADATACLKAAALKLAGRSCQTSEKSETTWRSSTVRRKSWISTKSTCEPVTALSARAPSWRRWEASPRQSSSTWRNHPTTAGGTSAWACTAPRAGSACSTRRVRHSGRGAAAAGCVMTAACGWRRGARRYWAAATANSTGAAPWTVKTVSGL